MIGLGDVAAGDPLGETPDEGLEVLTLLQTGKRDMVPVVFLEEPGGDYWAHFDAFVRRQLLDRGLISPQDLSLYKITDRVDEAVEEIEGFFRVYHSMRYVRNRVVLRLTRPLDETTLAELDRQYADILAEGRFTTGGPLPEERDEPDLADLPRLIFHFNRYDLGRLRQLIDTLNRDRIDGAAAS